MNLKPASALVVAALLATACGSAHSAPPRHHVAQAIAPAPSPSPTIPATRADRKVCRHFMGQQPGKRGANAYMAWATFGRGEKAANHASGRLITTTVRWFNDSYVSWGDPSRVNADWAAASALCASAGVNG